MPKNRFSWNCSSKVTKSPSRGLFLRFCKFCSTFAKSDKTKPLLDPCDPFSNRFRSKRFITCQNPKLLVLGCGGSALLAARHLVYMYLAWPFCKEANWQMRTSVCRWQGHDALVKISWTSTQTNQKKDKEFPFQKHQYSDKGLIFSTSPLSSLYNH